MTSKRLNELLSHFKDHTILVIGDVFLDHYVHGIVERLNPEAPVPILEARKEVTMTGGAGNVAKNIAALGAKTMLISVVGDDEFATILEASAHHEQYEPHLLRDAARSTIRKIRYVVGSQQLFRVDYEKKEDLAATLEKKLIAAIDEHLQQGVSGIIISDYAKGVMTASVAKHIIKEAQKQKIPVAADVKPHRALDVTGATFISPNLKEAHEFAGINIHNDRRTPQELSQLLTQKMSCDVFMTLSADGIYVCTDTVQKHVPQIHQPEVFDPSGGGDTAISVLLLAQLSGATPQEAAELANAAGAIVVSKIGSVGVTQEEISILMTNA